MLRVALLADRLPRAPWTTGPLAVGLARDLAARGHEVTLIADSLEHLPPGAGFAAVTRADFDHRARASLRGLAELAAAWLPRVRPEVTLSLSRLALGDVWMPVEPALWSVRGRLRRRLGPEGVPLCWGAILHDLKHLPSGALDAWTERRVNRPRDGSPSLHALLTFGPLAAADARRLLPALAGRVRALPLPALIPRTPPAIQAVLRKRTRQLLRIAPERVVALCSATSGIDHHLLPLLAAAAHLHAGHRGKGPLILVAAADAVAVHRTAARVGALGAIRVVSPTHRFEALLSAADLAVAPLPVAASPWLACGPARFAADALAHSRPLLAARAAPGAEFIRPDAPTAGLVVREHRLLDWYVALQTAMDPTWRVGCGIAARAVADVHGFAFPRVVDEIEATLARAAAARGGPATPLPPAHTGPFAAEPGVPAPRNLPSAHAD